MRSTLATLLQVRLRLYLNYLCPGTMPDKVLLAAKVAATKICALFLADSCLILATLIG
jgi:hypothetical protein